MMEALYGPNGEHPLSQHNQQHSRDVAESAMALMAYARQPQRLVGLLGIAGTLHDIEHRLKGHKNEQVSAKIAIREMQKVGGFNESEEQLVGDAILATRMRIDEAGRLVQSPQLRNFTQEVLADADLAHLGKPADEFLAVGDRLFRERYPNSPIGGEDYAAFDEVQLKFICGRRFYTLQADLLYPRLYDGSNKQLIKSRIFAR